MSALFDAWLGSGKPAVDGPGPNRTPALSDMPAAAQSFVERNADKPGNPFKGPKDNGH